VIFDIDWNPTVSGKTWDWIYFWIRDPDWTAMKAVDSTDCPDDQWPYEYVNAGPKYSDCQSFGLEYWLAHGIEGPNVDYSVLYQEGAPSSPTTGPTVTPPVPVTRTPCPLNTSC